MIKEKTKVKPLGYRVLVKKLDAEETLKGGIILPDTAKKKQEIAQVIALGTSKKASDGALIPLPVNEGDKILIDKYCGQDCSVDDEDYVIVNAEDIIAVMVN